MEKKEKAWQRRGLFALVSNRKPRSSAAEDELFFTAEDEEPQRPEEDETLP